MGEGVTSVFQGSQEGRRDYHKGTERSSASLRGFCTLGRHPAGRWSARVLKPGHLGKASAGERAGRPPRGAGLLDDGFAGKSASTAMIPTVTRAL